MDENNAPLEARIDALVDGALVSVDTTSASAALSGDISFLTVVVPGRETNTYLAPTGDIIAVMRRFDPLRASGVKGTVSFDEVDAQGDIKIALTGLTLPSSLLDATREDVLGVDVPSNIELEGITAPGGDLVTLPSILTMSLGDNPIKGDYVAFGARGPLWSVASQVRLVDVAAPLQSGVDLASLAQALLPLFAGRLEHAFVDVAPVEGARPADVTSFASWDSTNT